MAFAEELFLKNTHPGNIGEESMQLCAPGTGLLCLKQSCWHQSGSSKRQLQLLFSALPLGAGTCSTEGGDCVIKRRQEGLQ